MTFWYKKYASITVWITIDYTQELIRIYVMNNSFEKHFEKLENTKVLDLSIKVYNSYNTFNTHFIPKLSHLHFIIKCIVFVLMLFKIS